MEQKVSVEDAKKVVVRTQKADVRRSVSKAILIATPFVAATAYAAKKHFEKVEKEGLEQLKNMEVQ